MYVERMYESMGVGPFRVFARIFSLTYLDLR